MKKILVSFDDELANLLAKEKNMSEAIRKGTELYILHIVPDTLKGLRASYVQIFKQLKELDSKLDYIAKRIQDGK